MGEENIYTFGADSNTVIEHYKNHTYVSKDIYNSDELIKNLVDFIVSSDMIRLGDKEMLTRLYKELINKDWFMTLLDLKEYISVKEKALADYEDRRAWAAKALVNIAKSGFFSSDRTIAEYDKDIWKSRK